MSEATQTTELLPAVLEDGSPAPTPDDLFEKLVGMGISTSTISHEALFTVEQSARIKQDLPGGHTKNLFLKDKKSRYFLVVAEAHAEIPLKTIHTLIGAKGRVSFGNADKLMAYLGVRPGSVNAFAPMNDHGKNVSVVIDKALLEYDEINCHPLTNEMTTTISREDLLAFLKSVDHEAEIVQLSVEPGEKA